MALTTVQSGLLGSDAQALSFRNRIINGDMRIDQRNAGASITINTAPKTYTLDRWQVNGQPTAGVFTVQQSSTAPAGFRNSALITVTTPSTPTGSQYYLFCQRVEGYNVADLMWGTSNASPITISFWVRSSVTGTFSGTIENNDETRCYPFTYTINSANTFEYKTVTIPGDTTGTWNTTNGVGMFMWFSLGCGPDISTTAGSWAGLSRYAATGETKLISTSGATFYITGVQLEKGTTATPFETRPYGTELALCQRYYQIVANGNKFDNYRHTGVSSSFFVPFQVQMRASPSISLTRNSTVYGGVNTGAGSSGLDASNTTTVGTALYIYTNSVPEQVGVTATITANAEL